MASDELVLSGEYRDTIRRGRAPPSSTPWRSNRIVSSAWPLVAALLRGEAGVGGIAYCAVGAGLDSWDAARPATTPDGTHLVREVARVPITATDIRYVDAVGATVATPTHRLEITVTVVAADAPMRLREFALFAGEATSAANSGRMVNYVIHSRIDLATHDSLTRSVRLSFRPGGRGALDSGLLDIPAHWLAKEPVEMVDGVGAKAREALDGAGVTTVGDLARIALQQRSRALAPAKAIELRGKARLALRTAPRLPVLAPLEMLEVQEIMEAVPADLAGSSSLPLEAVEGLQDQIGLLQIALDARKIRHMSLAQLRGS